MEISCSKCGKEHKIPDNAVTDKKIFFYCNSCGHKIVVDNRKTFLDKTPSNKILPQITDLFNAIPVAFNSSSLLLGSIYGMMTLLLSLLTGLVIVKSNMMTNPGLLIFFGGIVGAIIYFFYIVLLYYLSKIALYKITNPSNEKIDWKYVNFDFKEDVSVLSIIYIVFVIAFAILLLPMIFLKSAGVIYSGILFPVIYAAAVLIVLSIVLMNFIPAVLACGSRFVGESFKDIVDFIKLEFLNLPAYVFVINILSAFVYGIVSFFTAIPLALAGAGIFAFAAPEAKASLMAFAGRISSSFAGGGGGDIAAHVTIGGLLLLLFSIVVLVFLWALLVSINQTLYTKAVYIMKKNPVKSINRKAYLIGLIILSLLLSRITSLVSLAGGLKNFLP